MQNSESVQTGGYVVQHDSGAFGKRFQLSHRRRLDDVEDTKKYKAREKRFPRERHRDQSYQLTRNLIDHHKLRIFYARAACDLRGGRNADQRDHRGQCNCNGRSQPRRKRVGQRRPQQYGYRRSPRPGPGPHPSDTEKCSRQRCPRRSSAGRTRDNVGATLGLRDTFHYSSSASSGALPRICSSASVTGDGIT